MLEHVVGYQKKLDDVEELIYDNLMVCKNMITKAMEFYGIEQHELDDYMKEADKSGRQADRISVSQTLKHFVRDWADEGAKERDEAFPCILSTLSSLKAESRTTDSLKVLLPGSGLGRLGHEVAGLGGEIYQPNCLDIANVRRVRSYDQRMVHVHECGVSFPREQYYAEHIYLTSLHRWHVAPRNYE
jgi:hypothetical protein